MSDLDTASPNPDVLAQRAAVAALTGQQVLAVSSRYDLGALDTALGELKLSLRSAPSGRTVVALLGRTRAGKSTLRYVLTGDGEEGIGRGGQRTTREVIDFEWEGLRLRDTPGVGARGGAEDAALAVEAAMHADLVLWLVGSDGLQQATLEPLRHVARRNTPLLFVVNHKDRHSLHDDRHWDGDELLTERPVRDRRLRQVLDGSTTETFEIEHVQLDVARWARGTPARTGAWEASGLPSLERAIAKEADGARGRRAGVRRVQQTAALHAVSVALDHLQVAVADSLTRNRAVLDQHRACIESESQVWRDKRDAAEARARQLIASHLTAAGRIALATEDAELAIVEWQSACTILDGELTTIISRELCGVDTPTLLEGNPVAEVRASLEGNPKRARNLNTGRNLLKVVAGAPFAMLGPAGVAAGAVVVPVMDQVVARNLGTSSDGERKKREDSIEEARERAEHVFTGRLSALLEAADEVHTQAVSMPNRQQRKELDDHRRLAQNESAAIAHALQTIREALDAD